MGKKLDKIKARWRGMRASTGFRDFVLYLAFVAVAALFWVIMSLNDNVTQTFDVHLHVDNVPDSVTFINDPPATFHVTLRDKGTNILRSGIISHPHVGLNFRDYADDGVFDVSKNEITQAVKSAFGNSAQLTAVSLDSLRLYYTTDKGRRVPIVVTADVTAAPGLVVSGNPKPMPRSALIYSYSENIDTITRVYTEPIVKRNLSETTEVEVAIRQIPKVKIVPSTVKVCIAVESLVKKESMVTVTAKNVPDGESLLLFPNRVPVTYYVPMSLFSSDLVPVEVSVDYNDIRRYAGDRIPVSIHGFAEYVESPQITTDSVEYTLVRQ